MITDDDHEIMDNALPYEATKVSSGWAVLIAIDSTGDGEADDREIQFFADRKRAVDFAQMCCRSAAMASAPK